MGNQTDADYPNSEMKIIKVFLAFLVCISADSTLNRKLFVPRDVHLAALISNASYKNTDEEIRDSLGTIGNRSLYLDPVVVKDSGWYGTGIWKERKCILTVHKRQFDGRLTLVIAFRGTNDKWDGLADLKYDQQDVTIGSVTGKVHTGFYDRYMEYQKNVKAEVDVIIKSLADKNTPVDEMIITGHSLGGAVATICYIDLYQKYSNQFKVFCITFGSPRVGNEELRLSMEPQRAYIGRFIIENSETDYSKNDPIPHLPANQIDSENDSSWDSFIIDEGQNIAQDVWTITSFFYDPSSAIVNVMDAELNRDEYRSIVNPIKLTCDIYATTRVDYHAMENYLKAARQWYSPPFNEVYIDRRSNTAFDFTDNGVIYKKINPGFIAKTQYDYLLTNVTYDAETRVFTCEITVRGFFTILRKWKYHLQFSKDFNIIHAIYGRYNTHGYENYSMYRRLGDYDY